MWVTLATILMLVALPWTQSMPHREEAVPAAAADAPVVDIVGMGKVEGRSALSYAQRRPYYSFLGIRYAKSPSGPLRFQPPELEEPWDDVRPAKLFGRKCPQTGIFRSGEFAETSRNDPRNWHARLEEQMGVVEEEPQADEDVEDCLYIQIYTPNYNATKKMPVMVFFHGGAYAGGSSNVYGGDKLMDKDVVLVVPHYRLGPLSFLSLGTDDIAGNAGLLDQVKALEWVNKFISNFGGDPERVTIFGESAGAASVSYLMLTPLAKGLFTHVIAESGSALSDWAIDLTPEYHSINIAEEAGCNVYGSDGKHNITEITLCLQTVDAMKLTRAYQTYKYKEEKRGHTGFGGCSPIIQKAGKVRFIEEHPDTLIRTGRYNHVPIMFGSNRDEGTYVLAIVYFGYMVPNNLVNDEEFLKFRMSDIALQLFNVKDPNFWLVDAIESRYEPPNAVGNFTLLMPGLIDILGAAFLKGPTYHVVQFNSQYVNSYHYTFNYNGSKSLWSMIGNKNSPFPGGICHSDELLYIFSIPLFPLNEKDKHVSHKMVALWTNFATYGNPTPPESPIDGVPEWPAYSITTNPYMRIMEEFTIQHNFTNEYTIDVDEGMTNDP
ncbi:juvenile hormone esterase-like [Ischnura elegans]|uniref:juvenile hormone esterase-like n=1 Tax=Ischnura elegans TaxID=197161 RepID=UPI001ED8766F|nr:juvenile hormone esterase-like [Ischnura elegans]